MSEIGVGEQTTKRKFNISWRMAIAVTMPGLVTGLVFGALMVLLSALQGRLFLTENPADPYGPPIPATSAQVVTSAGQILFICLIAGSFWGFLGTVALGLPIHGRLLRDHRTLWWMYSLAGVIAGIAFAAIMVVMSGVRSVTAMILPALFILGMSMLGGCIAATTFWIIRRPDRDAPSASQQPPLQAQ